MADKLYTEGEMKTLVLTRVNKIQKLNTDFVDSDSDEAFDSAIRECGFDLPIVSSDYIDIKNEWIIKRQVYFYYFSVRERNLLLIESGDMKAGALVTRLTTILTEMTVEFDKAKTSDAIAHLFVDAEMMFGTDPLVLPSGYVQDGVGQDITTYTTGQS